MKNNIIKIVLYCLSFAALNVALMGYFAYFYHANFFYNRMVFLFKDDASYDNVLMIELSKYNLLPYFYHYRYSAKLIGENSKEYFKKYEFNSINSDFEATDFMKKFTNINNYNTLNESYLLSFELEDKHYDINLQNLAGDFLVNNSLERFTYVNLGTTAITIDGKNYASDFAVTKTQSINMQKVTSDQKTALTGMAFFLSNKKGGLYYADITEVLSGGGEYVSHSWALHKNGDILRKEADSHIVFFDKNGREGVLELPNFQNASINIHTVNSLFSESVFYDLIQGDLLDDSGEKIITGFRLRYGKNS